MRSMLIRAASVAAVAAMATGFGLKGAIDFDEAATGAQLTTLDAFDELVGLRELKGRPADCGPINPSEERRVCPNTDEYLKPSECRNCRTKCSIMGDPHLSPFYSSCTQVVGNKPGNYLFWYVPKKGPRPAFNITLVVEKVIAPKAKRGHRRRHWITEIWLNGELQLTRHDCNKQKGMANVVNVTGVEKTWSDIALNKNKRAENDRDVTIDYRFACREWGDSRGVTQLLVEMELHDEVDGLTEEKPPKEMPPPTTPMFHNDKGMCNDPVVYGQPGAVEEDLRARVNHYRQYNLECTRRAPYKGDLEGRKCTCNAVCGAWGDPHINNFRVKPCRSSNKACQELMPVVSGKEGDLIPQNMLYQNGQVIAVRLQVDPRCHMIEKIHVYMMKPEYQKKWLACDEESQTSKLLESFPYDFDTDEGAWAKVTVDANEVCKSWGIGQATTVQIPSEEYGAEFVSEVGGHKGYAVGEYALHVDESTGVQSMVPLGYGDDGVKKDSECVSRQGFEPSQFAKKINGGVTRVVADCHRTKGKQWYFNACVNVNGVQVSDFLKNAKVFHTIKDLPDVGADFGKNGGNMLAEIQRAQKSSGWCSTGKLKKQSAQGIWSENKFRYRNPGEIEDFILVDRSLGNAP